MIPSALHLQVKSPVKALNNSWSILTPQICLHWLRIEVSSSKQTGTWTYPVDMFDCSDTLVLRGHTKAGNQGANHTFIWSGFYYWDVPAIVSSNRCSNATKTASNYYGIVAHVQVVGISCFKEHHQSVQTANTQGSQHSNHEEPARPAVHHGWWFPDKIKDCYANWNKLFVTDLNFLSNHWVPHIR